MDDTKLRQANKALIKKLLLIVLGSLAFAAAMVPFYDALCKITGLNGKTTGTATTEKANPRKIDTTRWVNVELNGTTMQGLSWEFKASQNTYRVHPGEVVTTAFHARNPTNQTLSGKAVPSVSPGWAAQYFNKIECFCFQKQTLKPGESKDMALTFFVSPDLPHNTNEIALFYTFFPIDDKE